MIKNKENVRETYEEKITLYVESTLKKLESMLIDTDQIAHDIRVENIIGDELGDIEEEIGSIREHIDTISSIYHISIEE